MNQIVLSAVIASALSLLIVNFQKICDFKDFIIWKLRSKNKRSNNRGCDTDDNRHD